MTNSYLTRYTAADLPALLERINKNSIGMEEYFNRLFNLHETTTNYPPYNLVTVSNVESRLELALAGFKKKQVNVYTQDGKLFVEGQREDGETGTDSMSTERSKTKDLSLDHGPSVTRRKLKDQFVFEDGLLSITLGKIVPDHHQRKDWF